MSHPDRFQLAGIHSMLCLWGAVCESMRHWNGYPSSDTTYRAFHGAGGSGRRLPIPDIPTIVVQLNAKVMALPEEQLEAVTAWYCFNSLKPAEKAIALGLTEQQLRRKVTKARVSLIATCENIL